MDLETRPFGSTDSFHVLAGGRCGRFSLALSKGRWPINARMKRDLGLIGVKPLSPGGSPTEQRVRLRLLRRVRVAQHPGLLLRVALYPVGGVHGGHIVAIWNQEGSGYALTMHFHGKESGGRTAQEATVLRAASAMSGTSASKR